MRADIVPGALFPNYELSDHAGKHRLKRTTPLLLFLASLRRPNSHSAICCTSNHPMAGRKPRR
jgi:hypothetical protein